MELVGVTHMVGPHVDPDWIVLQERVDWKVLH